MNKFDVIIIDLLNLYHRNFAVNEEKIQTIQGEPTKVGGIFGTLKSVQKLKNDWLAPDGKVYILNDNPTSVLYERKMIDSDYKINRISRPADFYRGLNYLALLFQSYDENMEYVQVPKMEADDLVPVVIEQNKGKSMLLCSSDMDWARGIDYHGENVKWFNGKELVSSTMFYDKYKFIPNEQNIIHYKVYRGDTADNIPAGLPNISFTLIEKLLDYGSFEQVMTDYENIDFLPKQWKQKIREMEGRLRLNHQLVSFIDLSYDRIKGYFIKCKYQPKVLKVFYEGLNFNISQVDKRLLSDIEKSKKNKVSFDSFFIQPSRNRV